MFVVIGNGNFAAKQALWLRQISENVIIIANSKKNEMSKELEKSLEEKKVPIIFEKISGFSGSKNLEKVITENGEYKTKAAFLSLGNISALSLALDLGLVHDKTYIKVDPLQKTSLEGVFALGRCTGTEEGSLIIAEGAKAANTCLLFLEKL